MARFAGELEIDLAVLMDMSAACGSQVVSDGSRFMATRAYRSGCRGGHSTPSSRRCESTRRTSAIQTPSIITRPPWYRSHFGADSLTSASAGRRRSLRSVEPARCRLAHLDRLAGRTRPRSGEVLSQTRSTAALWNSPPLGSRLPRTWVMDLANAWPPFGLRLRHRNLELRAVTDRDALSIASWIPALLPPEQQHFMPHLYRSFGAASPEETERLELQWIWRQRASMSPDEWGLSLTIVVDGEPVGVQGLQASGFRVRRTIGSGSFLVSDRRRAGIGTRARAMMLSLAFDHLGALAAESGYMDGNDASRIVSERLGYLPNGVAFHEFEGLRCRENRVLLEAERWRSVRAAWIDQVDVEGIDPLRRQLDISAP